MKLSFFGAAKEVTGSCYMIEVLNKKILVDCGLKQGRDDDDNDSFPFSAGEIDAVILTHAHLDHSGRIPLLAKQGFKGKIYSTGATLDLCSIMLKDSGHIQEMEADWKKRKGKRQNKADFQPLYTVMDAEEAIKLFSPCVYNELVNICEGVTAKFTDIGHLLGSSSVEVFLNENGESKKLVFSGDIGNINQPLVKDPICTDSADIVICESTYGDKLHDMPVDLVASFAEVIERTLKRGGNVIIPSFAVGRTQELLYFFREIKERELVSMPFPVYVDSPLAVECTNIYKRDYIGYYDNEAMHLIEKGINPISFEDLKLSVTSDESKAINFETEPSVIISASGMCEAGRIRHHLKHNLWRQECSVVFVGYQAEGTLGRIILDGAKTVKLFGETISVNAEIVKYKGISGHADLNGLLKWLYGFKDKPYKIFTTHGEAGVIESFRERLLQEGYSAYAPNFTAVYDILKDAFVDFGIEKVKKEEHSRNTSREYTALYSTGLMLMDIIEKSKKIANKDLIKFKNQLDDLMNKWR